MRRSRPIRSVVGALLGLAACRTPAPAEYPGPPPPTTWHGSLIEQANDDLSNGDHARALRRGLAALQDDPDDVDAHAVVGAALWRRGDVAGSTAAYHRGVMLSPTDFGAVLGLARNLQATGRHHLALAVLDRLVAQDTGQVDPHLGRLWSHHALGNVDAAARDLERIATLMPAGDPLAPLVGHIAGLVTPLVGKGPFFVVEGHVGSTDAELDARLGLKRATVTIGGARHQAVFAEFRDEIWIDTALADALGLATQGEFTPIDTDERTRIVIVPQIAIGGITLRRVPAIVRPLGDLAVDGPTPGVALGRPALAAFGTLGFDFPRRLLVVTAAPPTRPPPGAVELPLVLPTTHLVHFPAVPIRVGDGPPILAYLGGLYAADAALPAEAIAVGGAPVPVATSDEFRLVDLRLGDRAVPGIQALVLPTHPRESGLDTVLRHTGLEITGYLDVALLRRWHVTYALGLGRVYIGA